MGFFKKLFQGQQISEEEQVRRMGSRCVSQKSVKEMSGDEQRQYWFQSRDLPDLDERLREWKNWRTPDLFPLIRR